MLVHVYAQEEDNQSIYSDNAEDVHVQQPILVQNTVPQQEVVPQPTVQQPTLHLHTHHIIIQPDKVIRFAISNIQHRHRFHLLFKLMNFISTNLKIQP